ncbi:MAG TPA: hypothetical protein VKB78_06020, partial [Pirellulales bacterium]|nr:hypothetical protein [Pirellulales bacterium]
MLSRFSVLLVSGVVLLSTLATARGQDERPSTNSLWPFGKFQNPIHWPGTNQANSGANAGSSDLQNGAQTNNTNTSNQQSTASDSTQSDNYRRFYGPSMALRPGVAYGYAPPNGNPPPATNAPQTTAPQTSRWPRFISGPQLSPNDTNPVISQGSPSAGGTSASPPGDADVRLPASSPAIMHNRTADDFRPSASTGNSLAQDFQSAGAAPKDTRSVKDRLAAMRQSSDRGTTTPSPATAPSVAVTAKPAPTMVDVTTSIPVAPAISGDAGTLGVPYAVGAQSALSHGPSSRRVVDSATDADEAIADAGRADGASRNSPRATVPNTAASIGSTVKNDSTSAAGAPSQVTPRNTEFIAKAEGTAKPAAIKTDPFRTETVKSETPKPETVKPDAIKLDSPKLGSDVDAHKIDIGSPGAEKFDMAAAPRSPIFNRTEPVETADADDPSASSGQARSAAKAGVLFTRQSPLVSVETTGPRSIVIGREATYQIAIKNAGDVGAQDLTVSVKIPEWTDVAGSQATAGTTRAAPEANEPFQWKIPKLDAHGKETLSLRLLPRKGRGFDLAVQWTFTPIASQTVVDVQEPKLNMTIAGPDEVVFGQSKVYRLTIANPGTGDAENVVVQLDPIGNSTAPPTRHPIGTIRAGDSKVVELELTARQTGSVSIRASATAEPGLTAEAAQDVLVRRAAVALSVEGAKSRFAGTPAAYAIKITNSGNATAENVHISATLPAGAKFISASSGGQLKAEQGKVVWSLPPLHAGGDTAIELKCALANPGPNRLQVASSAAGDVSDAAAITTNVEALADLK